MNDVFPPSKAAAIEQELRDHMDAARAQLRAAWGLPKYADASRSAQAIIRRVMTQNRMDVFEATSRLAKRADEEGRPVDALLVAAACLDIIDPEEAPSRTTVLHA